jgi:hypothetical protein
VAQETAQFLDQFASTPGIGNDVGHHCAQFGPV